jgi:hypothetical protein
MKDKPKTPPDSTLGRLRDFLKTLLTVSKSELDEALVTEKAVAEPIAEENDVEC